MAIDIQNTAEAVYPALVSAFNLLKREVCEGQTTYPHADITSTTTGDFRNPAASSYIVTATNASSLATLRTLARDIYRVQTTHFADARGHKAADTVNTIAFGLPAEDESLVNLQTMLNQAKASCNAHTSQAGVHFTADGTNTGAAADATDQGTSNTLANAIKTFLNAHIIFSFTSPSIRLVG